MKRSLTIVIALMLLALPLTVGAYTSDNGWMPPGWTPYPPARGIINQQKLMQLLVEKGVLTPQEAARVRITPQEAAQLYQASDIVMGHTKGPVRSASGN